MSEGKKRSPATEKIKDTLSIAAGFMIALIQTIFSLRTFQVIVTLLREVVSFSLMVISIYSIKHVLEGMRVGDTVALVRALLTLVVSVKINKEV